MRPFQLIERDLESGQREILVHGELDLAVADQLREAIEQSGCLQILIGLEACDFIDSTGIAVIVHAHQEAAAGGGKVAVHSPNRQVLRVLTVTGLTDNDLVFESLDAAVLSAPLTP